MNIYIEVLEAEQIMSISANKLSAFLPILSMWHKNVYPISCERYMFHNNDDSLFARRNCFQILKLSNLKTDMIDIICFTSKRSVIF